MSYDNLQAVRDAASTTPFQQMRNELGQRVWPTKQLKKVEADIRRLHQQVADVKDPTKPWGDGNRHKAGGLIILGSYGSSKSYCIDYALSTLPPVVLADGTTEPANLLYREVPKGEARGWLRDVSSMLGYPATRLPQPELAMSNIESGLRRKKFTLVAFDEMTRVLNPRSYPTKNRLVEQSEIVWSQVIQIMDDAKWPTPVIVSGTPELRDTLTLENPKTREIVARGDVARRSDITMLPALDMGDAGELEYYLDEYCKMAGVTNRLTVTDDAGRRLVNASRRAIGTALRYAQQAVALASLRRRGALQISDLAHVLAIRGGVPADANIFLVDEWEDIDFEKIAPTNLDDARYAADDKEEVFA